MPARPTPLITKGPFLTAGKSPFSPLPSELPRTPVIGGFDSLKSRDEQMKTPITPPTAYTDFLKNTMNSPALSSAPPSSLPYSPALSTGGYRSGYYTPVTPFSAPLSAAQRRPPRSLPSPDSPVESPRQRHRRKKTEDSDESDDESERDDDRVTVKQVVTTTVTYSTPRMSLLPAPKGKRRRIA